MALAPAIVIATVAAVIVATNIAAAGTQATARKLTAQEQRAPCAELITNEEIRSLRRRDVLAQVSGDSPGSSICGWEDPKGAGAGFIVARQTAAWFKYEDTSGPKESFDIRRKAYDSVVGTDPVPGIGLEARITRHKELPTVLIRRAADVLLVTCADCNRDQTIALAKLAAAP
jgi:hypothetical protein